MTIKQRYQFYLTLPGGTPIQFDPCLSELKFKKSRYKDECFFRLDMESELTIDGDLFKTLYALKQNKCLCLTGEITILSRCSFNDPFTVCWKGTFNGANANWNPEKCKVTFTPELKDVYTCLLDNWKRDRNYLEITDRINISNIQGTIVCTDPCVAPFIQTGTFGGIPIGYYGDCYPDGESGWTLTLLDVQQNITPLGPTVYLKTYCREELNSTTTPIGIGWIEESPGFWVRPVSVSTYPVVTTSEIINNNYHTYYTYSIVNYATTQAITLQSLFDYFLSDCFECIISNFFGINSDGTAPNNIAYDCAAKDLHSLAVVQASDLIAPNGLNATSVQQNPNVEIEAGVKNFCDLWHDLKRLFRVCMWFDNETNCLRIEHVSYKRNGQILDLTLDFKKRLIGKGSFISNVDDIPRYEYLKFDYDTGQKDFNDGSLIYPNECSNPDGELNEKNNVVECFVTDVANLYGNSNLSTNESVLSKTVLLSTENGIIKSSIGVLSGNTILNGPLAGSNLISKYYLHDRPTCNGIMNGNNTTFIDTVKTNKQTPIDLNLAHTNFKNLDPEIDRLKTQFGYTCIDSIEYLDPGEQTTIESSF